MLIGPRHPHKCSLNHPIGQLADILLPPYSRQVDLPSITLRMFMIVLGKPLNLKELHETV